MKSLSILLIALAFFSCTKQDDTNEKMDCRDVAYNQSLDLVLDDEVCFPDGNSFKVISVEHGFCPCGLICIWAGEMKITLETVQTNEETQEMVFGSTTVVYQREIFGSYKITDFSYSYDSSDSNVPFCAEDFEPEKFLFKLTVSPN